MLVKSGYISANIGRQVLSGPAVDSIRNATDINSAPRIDNDQWQAALTKNRELMDRIHDSLFAE